MGEPHVLQGLAVAAVVVVRVVDEGRFGERCAAWIACVGEQRAGGRSVEGVSRRGRVGRAKQIRAVLVVAEAGRDEARRGDLTAAHDVRDEGVAIDRVRERAPDAGIVERFPGGVEPYEFRRDDGADDEHLGAMGPVLGNLRDGQLVCDVDLAGAEQALLGAGVLDGQENDLAERDAGARPIVRIAFGDDFLVRRPGGQRERSVRDEVARTRPLRVALGHVAERLDGRAVDGVVGEVDLHQEEVGCGRAKPDDERARIGRGHADPAEIGERSSVELLGVLDGIEEVGVFSGERGREDASPTVDEIIGGDGIAVRPFRAVAEMEGIVEAVVGDVPGLGDTGDRLHRLEVDVDEALEHRREQTLFDDACDDVRVERLGFAAVADAERGGVVRRVADSPTTCDRQESERGDREQAGHGGSRASKRGTYAFTIRPNPMSE